jgi:hypothetical protein
MYYWCIWLNNHFGNLTNSAKKVTYEIGAATHPHILVAHKKFNRQLNHNLRR